MSSLVVNRYAKAFFETANAKGQVASLVTTLDSLGDFLDKNPVVADVLGSLVIPMHKKEGLLKALFQRLALDEAVLGYLTLLLAKKRLSCLRDISKRLQMLSLHHQGIVPLRVEYVQTLEDSSKQAIETKFAKMLSKKIRAEYVENPDLVGGVRVTCQGQTYDGSLVGILSTFEEKKGRASLSV